MGAWLYARRLVHGVREVTKTRKGRGAHGKEGILSSGGRSGLWWVLGHLTSIGERRKTEPNMKRDRYI